LVNQAIIFESEHFPEGHAALAQELEKYLVTVDKEILRAFSDSAISLDRFVG